MISTSDTIAHGKSWLRTRLLAGDQCPLCHQHAQMYKRKINSGMARSLIHMYRTNGTGWVHVKVIGAQSREEGKLVHWGLVEEQPGSGPSGSGHTGYWRVTAKGARFLKDQQKVPKYALLYNGRFYGHDGDPIGIKDALGTRFDYEDLMNGI